MDEHAELSLSATQEGDTIKHMIWTRISTILQINRAGQGVTLPLPTLFRLKRTVTKYHLKKNPDVHKSPFPCPYLRKVSVLQPKHSHHRRYVWMPEVSAGD